MADPIETQDDRINKTHVGHFFADYMRQRPDDICQIDAATGEQETRRSVLSRTIRLAQCLRTMGLQPGDVLALGGRNHLDVHIPFYAAMMIGLPVAGVDLYFKHNELKHLFKILEPKLAFCDYAMYGEYRRAVEELGLDTKIVSFKDGEFSMAKLMETCHDPQPEEAFRVAALNPDEAYCWLVSTSGSSGRPKVVALTHTNVLQNFKFFEFSDPKTSVRQPALNMSALNWISGCFNALLMPIHHVKLQTSAQVTIDHVIDIINQYKPVGTLMTPSLIAPILHHEKHCDLTCFDVFKMGGSKIHKDLLATLRARMRKDTVILQGYGLTESGGIMISTTSDHPIGTVGKLEPTYTAKLVIPETGEEILKPNVTGELLLKGPRMACYYKDPKSTEEAFTEDGFYKTGDLMYRDENDYYFFVDRHKMLLKYKSNQVVPPELEEVILTHDCVDDVCVTGVPHPDDGEHVTACVVRKPGSKVTAQEIKDLVANHFSDSKHLRGGVVFVDALPLTSNGKIARIKVKELVLTAHRE